jgi:hypothetical protein
VSRSGDVTGELITTRYIRARGATASSAATAAAAPTTPTTDNKAPSTSSSDGVPAWQLPIEQQEMVFTMTNQQATATRYFARLSSSLPPAVRMTREEEVVDGDEEVAKIQAEVLAELTRK